MANSWIADALKKANKKQVELAKHLGVSESVMSKIIHSPKRVLGAEEKEKILKFLGEPDASGSGSYASPRQNSSVRHPDVPLTVPFRSEMKEDVPVYGTALGGGAGGHEFIMNGDSGLRVLRPPRLEGRDDVFALFVQGDSMEPRYPAGELIFCEQKRPPQIGDFVVIEMKPTPDGVQVAYLKRLTGRSGGKLKLEQYNPPKVFELGGDDILQVVRVMTMLDLLGK